MDAWVGLGCGKRCHSGVTFWIMRTHCLSVLPGTGGQAWPKWGGVSIRCRHKVLFSRAVRGVVRVRDLFRLPRSAQGEATVVCVIVRFVEAMSLVGLSGKRDVTAGDCPFASSSRATLFPPPFLGCT